MACKSDRLGRAQHQLQGGREHFVDERQWPPVVPEDVLSAPEGPRLVELPACSHPCLTFYMPALSDWQLGLCMRAHEGQVPNTGFVQQTPKQPFRITWGPAAAAE